MQKRDVERQELHLLRTGWRPYATGPAATEGHSMPRALQAITNPHDILEQALRGLQGRRGEHRRPSMSEGPQLRRQIRSSGFYTAWPSNKSFTARPTQIRIVHVCKEGVPGRMRTDELPGACETNRPIELEGSLEAAVEITGIPTLHKITHTCVIRTVIEWHGVLTHA